MSKSLEKLADKMIRLSPEEQQKLQLIIKAKLLPEIDRISTRWLKRSWKRRDAFPKKLKDPKFRATAKLKDYKSSL